ncbi:MAG: 6-carboxytetrahydropterin synthase [Marinagarivorans sp.]
MRLFVDQLTNVDFSYLCPARGLLGETWLASIQLVGSLDEQGMVCDFGTVKKHLRQWLDDTLDHKLLVPSRAPQLALGDDKCHLNFTYADDLQLSTRGPASAFCHIPTERITPASVAAWCIEQLAGHFGPGVSGIELSFRPETLSGPYYHYSHGLKKHLGNCQRIAHGHRSGIQIWRNDVLCHASMQQVAQEWRDIYIGTRADIVADHASHWEFAYGASQGEFRLQIPKTAVYLMDDDTTVENITAHLAAKLKATSPQDRWVVKAYEGIGKGAEVRC